MIKIYNDILSFTDLYVPTSNLYTDSNRTFEDTRNTIHPTLNTIRWELDRFYRQCHRPDLDNLSEILSRMNNLAEINSVQFPIDTPGTLHYQIVNEVDGSFCFYEPNTSFQEIDPELAPTLNQSLVNFYYNNFSNDLFYNKAKLVGEYQGKKVYSSYPKVFFESFEDFYIQEKFTRSALSLNNFHNFTNFRNPSFRRDCHDFLHNSFLKPAASILSSKSFYSSYDLLTISFEELNNQLNSARYKSILLPSWSVTKSAFPSFQNLTANQTSKRRGLFVPVLTKVNSLGSGTDCEEVYYLSLALISSNSTSFSSFFDFQSIKPSNAKALIAFFDLFSFEDGLFFKSQQEYITKRFTFVNSLLKVPLKRKVVSSKTQKYIDHLLNISQDSAFSTSENFDAFTEDSLKLLSLKMPSDNNSKVKKRIQDLFEKGFKKLTEDKIKFNLILLNKNNILKASLRNFIISNFQANKLSSLTKQEDTTDVCSSLALFTSAKHAKQTRQSALNKNFKNNIDLQNASYSESLINLAKENVYIESITYYKGPNDFSNLLNKDSSKEEVFSFLQLPNHKKFNLNFVVDKIIPIYVDGKTAPKAVKAGGPYKVQLNVRDENYFDLRIAPLNSKTIFSCETNRYFIIHPHASSRSKDSFFNGDFVNCCLGEATSTISWALKQTNFDLSRLILSIMVWLTSANSTDVWGKRYLDFPDYNDFDFDSPPLFEEPSQDEIDAFLNSDDQDIDPVGLDVQPSSDVQENDPNQLDQEDDHIPTPTLPTYTPYITNT